MIVAFTIHDAVKLGFLGGHDLGPIISYARRMALGDGMVFRVDDDTPMLAGGIIPLWGKVGEAWMMFDDSFRSKMPRSLARMAKRHFQNLAEHRGYERVQAHIDARLPVNSRFAEWLGFRNEGLMPRYMPDGGDAYRYALLPGGA